MNPLIVESITDPVKIEVCPPDEVLEVLKDTTYTWEFVNGVLIVRSHRTKWNYGKYDYSVGVCFDTRFRGDGTPPFRTARYSPKDHDKEFFLSRSGYYPDERIGSRRAHLIATILILSEKPWLANWSGVEIFPIDQLVLNVGPNIADKADFRASTGQKFGITSGTECFHLGIFDAPDGETHQCDMDNTLGWVFFPHMREIANQFGEIRAFPYR